MKTSSAAERAVAFAYAVARNGAAGTPPLAAVALYTRSASAHDEKTELASATPVKFAYRTVRPGYVK